IASLFRSLPSRVAVVVAERPASVAGFRCWRSDSVRRISALVPQRFVRNGLRRLRRARGSAKRQYMSALRIAPSLLSSDIGHLAQEIDQVAAAGADWIHVDVMDGRFVPNFTFGTPIVRAARAATKLPLDVHLMMVEPERYI